MRNRWLWVVACLVAGCGAPAEVPPADSPAREAVAPAAPSPPPSPSASAASSASAAAHPAPHWTYSGEEGPAKWGAIAPEFAKCSSGTEQTPIDLSAKAPKGAALAPLQFGLAPLPALLVNNGHTVQLSARGAGATLVAGGKKYELVQFHGHAPSEHTLDKKSFDGELHFVHEGEGGSLAVVGVLLKRGKENADLAPYFDHLPAAPTKDPVKVEGAKVDLSRILPAKAGYFAYTGSLTTPPCSEGVRWFVLATPVEVSEAQLAKFHAAVPGDSNRPVQPLGARAVEAFRP
jgi:carbonic anhydrase